MFHDVIDEINTSYFSPYIRIRAHVFKISRRPKPFSFNSFLHGNSKDEHDYIENTNRPKYQANDIKGTLRAQVFHSGSDQHAGQVMYERFVHQLPVT